MAKKGQKPTPQEIEAGRRNLAKGREENPLPALRHGAHSQHMRTRVWKGEVSFLKFAGGRKVWIDAHDLERFIEQNKRTFGK